MAAAAAAAAAAVAAERVMHGCTRSFDAPRHYESAISFISLELSLLHARPTRARARARARLCAASRSRFDPRGRNTANYSVVFRAIDSDRPDPDRSSPHCRERTNAGFAPKRSSSFRDFTRFYSASTRATRRERFPARATRPSRRTMGILEASHARSREYSRRRSAPTFLRLIAVLFALSSLHAESRLDKSQER